MTNSMATLRLAKGGLVGEQRGQAAYYCSSIAKKVVDLSLMHFTALARAN